jgi:hypothetical protein
MCIIKPYPPRSGSGTRGGFIAPLPPPPVNGVVNAAPIAPELQDHRDGRRPGGGPRITHSAARLDQRLSAWRTALRTNDLAASIYVDAFFNAPGQFVGGDRIVTNFVDPSALPDPPEETVTVLGSYVNANDYDPDHPTGRYLVRGSFGTVWVSQWVAFQRFLEAHPI